MPDHRYAFRFTPTTRLALAALRVTSATAYVEVDSDLLVRWGPWTLRTAIDNVIEVVEFGSLNPLRALGLRLSLADRGITFGTSTAGGVCFRFRDPVPAIEPFGLFRHPGATVTVADPDALAADVRGRMTR